MHFFYTCSDPHTRKSIVVNFVVLYKPHAIFVLRKVRKNARINTKSFIELSVVANCRQYSCIKGKEDIGVGRGWEGTGCYPY